MVWHSTRPTIKKFQSSDNSFPPTFHEVSTTYDVSCPSLPKFKNSHWTCNFSPLHKAFNVSLISLTLSMRIQSPQWMNSWTEPLISWILKKSKNRSRSLHSPLQKRTKTMIRDLVQASLCYPPCPYVSLTSTLHFMIQGLTSSWCLKINTKCLIGHNRSNTSLWEALTSYALTIMIMWHNTEGRWRLKHLIADIINEDKLTQRMLAPIHISMPWHITRL